MQVPSFELIDLTPPWIAKPETIVFSHGVGSTSALWAEWLPSLVDRYRILTFDMRGFGRSAKLASEAKWSMAELIGDIKAVIESANLNRVHLVGESVGGTLAIAFALKYPQHVLTLTVSNASYVGTSVQKVHEWRKLIEREGVAGWSNAMMADRFKSGQITDAKWNWYQRVQSDQLPEAILGALSVLLNTDLGNRLPELKMPVLLMHGDSPARLFQLAS